jgi:hypothetical protein
LTSFMLGKVVLMAIMMKLTKPFAGGGAQQRCGCGEREREGERGRERKDD